MKRGLFLIVMMLISLASMAQFDNEFWFAPPYANPVHDPNNTFRFVISTSTLPSTVTITQPANPSSFQHNLLMDTQRISLFRSL
ncbi:MAG TPA: hypothetical protein PLI77_05340 [Bacteroidales bacterium]|nr:hypothetical protein [Bacteroidales bacterium]